MTYSFPHLLYCFVRIRCPKEMLTEEHNFWFPMLEPHQRVFPVPNMVPEADVQHLSTEVVAVEKEPESVNDAVAFVDDYQNGRRITTATSQGAFL